jgi:hypothetical protein
MFMVLLFAQSVIRECIGGHTRELQRPNRQLTYSDANFLLAFFHRVKKLLVNIPGAAEVFLRLNRMGDAAVRFYAWHEIPLLSRESTAEVKGDGS